MFIHIDRLAFETIIGLLDFERDRPQRVIVDLEASYDYDHGHFINYADIVLHIQNELKEKKYKLLEEALLGLKERIHSHYPTLNTLKIKISKPDILPDCNVALSQNWEF